MTAIYRSDDARQSVEAGYRALLDRWPVPSTRTTLPTRHGDTFVLACGPEDAAPVVLLHGAGFNSAAWAGDAALWARTHRLYAVDVLGEAGLSAPARPSLASDAYAEWLDDVLDGLGVARTAFVGASLGGWLALDYALRRPGRVRRVALLVPGGIGRQKYAAVLASAFLMPFGERGRRAALDLVVGPRPSMEESADDPAMLRALGDQLLLIQRGFRYRRDPLPTFTDDQLRGLAAPLLVVAGAKDRMLDSPGTARRVRQLLPDADVVLLPGVGHIPTGYAEPVHRFLTNGDPR
ncbi:alpha/beta fold hydrolase [Jiangella rhizosphaerae]|uniref:Alpha/beta fold hydrolase n=1 Tax=Jiangella rhizosphaerae TaxID=2293569 RepID=A0A418KLL0_9ACTN|nr:alpha/beta fold hydrolase [Jiangella rhizosphaerae]RIQ18812.1 alpha/beta fold hydrolase [Jiangella rhizosphaerae]